MTYTPQLSQLSLKLLRFSLLLSVPTITQLLFVSFTACDYFINVSSSFLTLILFTSIFNCSWALRCGIYLFPFPLAPVCLSPTSPRGTGLCISMLPSSFSELTLAYSFHPPSHYSTFTHAPCPISAWLASVPLTSWMDSLTNSRYLYNPTGWQLL